MDDTLPCSYAPLPPKNHHLGGAATPRRRRLVSLLGILSLALFATILLAGGRNDRRELVPVSPISRGPHAGVSEKSSGVFLGESTLRYPWTNPMLSWQRTAFHFQPEKNWMNGSPSSPSSLSNSPSILANSSSFLTFFRSRRYVNQELQNSQLPSL